MSIQADDELRLSVQLESDASGVDLAAMRHLLSDAELKLVAVLTTPISTKDRDSLREILGAITLANEIVVKYWEEQHAQSS
jgi:hypothetical protein